MKLFNVYPIYDVEISRGEGSWVFDKEGNRYLDFYGGHAVISIGHAHPKYVSAIKHQVSDLGFYSNSVINPVQERLAKKLGALSGYEDYDLFLVNSGAEANENALKLASFHTGRSKVISFHRGFHGRTSAAVNVTDNPKIIAPINRGFENVSLAFDDYDGVKSALAPGDVAAIIIEGLQGIAGIYEPSADFIHFLKSEAGRHGTLLILDEIQSGFGRTGHFFAHQIHSNLQPDLITTAKGMGNGFPIGGVLISPKFEAKFGLLGTTFGGNHLACAAGLAVLEVIEEDHLLSHVQNIGNQLYKGLTGLADIVEIRGRGAMLGIEFPYSIKELRKKMLLEHGLFVGSAAHPNTIRLLPPLNVSEAEVKVFLEKFSSALAN